MNLYSMESRCIHPVYTKRDPEVLILWDQWILATLQCLNQWMRNQEPQIIQNKLTVQSFSENMLLFIDFYSRSGCVPGEGAFKEVAAYLLDRYKISSVVATFRGHFAGVPSTTLMEFSGECFQSNIPKIGALQQVRNYLKKIC